MKKHLNVLKKVKVTKRNLAAVSLSLIMVLGLAACGQSAPAPAEPAPAAAPAEPAPAEPAPAEPAPAEEPASTGMNPADIVVAGMVFQEDQFMKSMLDGYEAAAKDMGVKTIQTSNSANDIAKEKELIETYQSAGVNGLAIAVFDAEVAIPALEAADASGMKIAATNIDLDAPFIVGGYTSDGKALGAQCGEAAATYIKDNLGGKAKIGIIHFLEQLPEQGQQRIDGYKSSLEGLDVEYVADYSAPAADQSLAKTGDMITANPDINVILCCNDGGTKGAVAAVKAAGKAGQIAVFGFDVDDEVIDMLKSDDNILQAAIGQDPYKMGYDAMAQLIKAIMGEDYSATKGKTTIVPGKLADRANPATLDQF